MKITAIFKTRNDLRHSKEQLHYSNKKAYKNDFSKVLNECMVTRED